RQAAGRLDQPRPGELAELAVELPEAGGRAGDAGGEGPDERRLGDGLAAGVRNMPGRAAAGAVSRKSRAETSPPSRATANPPPLSAPGAPALPPPPACGGVKCGVKGQALVGARLLHTCTWDTTHGPCQIATTSSVLGKKLRKWSCERTAPVPLGGGGERHGVAR